MHCAFPTLCVMDQPTDHVAREKARGAMRGFHLRALEEAGRARAAALEEADQQLQRIGRLLPDALDAGISMAHAGRVAGVSRPTLYELRAKYGEGAIDFNFTLLETLARRGPLSRSELEHHLGASAWDHAIDFHRQGLLDVEPDARPEGEVPVFGLAHQGFELLEHWRFHVEEREAGGES